VIPDIPIKVPVIGSTALTGILFQVHIVIVAFIMGAAILAPTAEWLSFRPGGERWGQLAHDLSSTIVRLFAFGATWVVFALVAIYGLYPRLFGVLTGIFFWPLVVVLGIWFVMTVSAYLYYETWDRLGPRRKLHMAIGWTFAISTFSFISLIIFLSSYQLTPTAELTLRSAALNPSWPTEFVHRHVGNLSYAALLLAAFASTMILFPRRRGREIDVAHYDWLSDAALLLGLSLALLQPFAGWFYAHQVQVGSPGAFERMMAGENAWLFLVQGFFLGAVLFLGNLYLALSIRRGNSSPQAATRMWTFVWIIGALVLLLLVPKEVPLGQMRPWKYMALGGLVLFSFVNLVLYFRERRTFTWGSGGRGLRWALAITGLSIVFLMITMGVIRESARGSYLIYGYMKQEQSQQLERP